MKRSSAVLLAVVALFITTNALAWGPDGHKIVCRIAFQLLDNDAQRAEVDRLTKAYQLPNGLPGYTSFPEACTFADRARGNAQAGTTGLQQFKPIDEWDLLNVSRNVQQ